jgi:hypothetical protein
VNTRLRAQAQNSYRQLNLNIVLCLIIPYSASLIAPPSISAITTPPSAGLITPRPSIGLIIPRPAISSKVPYTPNTASSLRGFTANPVSHSIGFSLQVTATIH